MQNSNLAHLVLWLASSLRRPPVMLYKASLCLSLCFSLTFAAAQDLSDSQTVYALPSLDSLISLSLKNSPSLKMSEAQIQQQKFQLNSRKLEWTNNISANTNAGIGNVLLWNGGVETGFTSTIIPQYRAGVNIDLPLNRFVDRKNQVGMAEAQYRAAKFQKDVQAEELTGRVTTLYFQLVTNINVLKIRRDALQTLQIQKALAEKDLQNGNIGIVEMSAMVREYANAQESYETFKQSFLLTWKQMEYLVGQPLKLIP